MNAYDDENEPVELGASIFVKVNHNLVNAANAFNLSTSAMIRAQSEAPELGVWNGEEFVFVQAGDSNWWDTAKILWKYGLAPIKTLRLMKATVGKFLKMYEKPYFPFKSLSETAYELDLTAITAQTGQQFLDANGIGGLFPNHVIQASTRVNYAQNLGQIHGLEAMVCMATDGAMAIEGGNWKIFDGMLKASGAQLHLNTAVTNIVKSIDGSYVVISKSTESRVTQSVDREVFDEVILAGPRQFANIDFAPEPRHSPDAIPYVQLHVTLFASEHLLSPAAFNLPADQPVPQVILTTTAPAQKNIDMDFLSISQLRAAIDIRHGSSNLEYLYKIFSMTPVNSTFLAHILGFESLGPDDEINSSDISWMYRKLWNSYPYELPRVTFEESKLDDHLWYTSGIESFISTMETSSLMGMNVARLMVDEWLEV